MKFKVVITDYIYGEPDEETKVLCKIDAELELHQCKTEDEVLEVSRGADGILNTYAPMPRRVIEGLERCKAIARYGIGFDTIDGEAATEKGIAVMNVPTYCVDEVADHTLALILAASRKVLLFDHSIRNGGWDWREGKPIQRLRTQTLGLVAVGKIGRALVERIKPIGMRVIAFDPYIPDDKMREMGVEPVSFDKLLEESDIISVHTPLTKETRHMLGYEQFKKMKRTAILVNTSRGPVVNIPDLIMALEERRIALAALDVLEKEPPAKSDPILKLDNVILTPHTAFYSEGSVKESKITASEDVARVLTGKRPMNCVNPKVLERLGLK
jgi:D-3-phosphoglycerate dehydrogenase / 2-oxoglutarate reductase